MILGLLYLFAEGVSQLLLVPMISKAYGPEKAGLWFVINNFLVLIQIGQAGLGPAAIRGLASVAHKPISAFNSEYAKVTHAYRIALGGFLLVLALLTLYIEKAAGGQESWATLWLFFAAGLATRMYAWKWLNAVNALGNVGLDKVIMVSGVLLSTSAYITILNFGMSISILGIAYGCLGLIHVFLCWILYSIILSKHRKTATASTFTTEEESTETSTHYLALAFPFVILNVSGFFVMNFDVIVAERLFGAAILPHYFVLAKLGLLLLSVATLYQQMSYPFVAAAWSQGRFTEASKLYRRGLKVSLGVAVSGAAVMLLAAPYVIPLWLGPGAYLGFEVFAAQLLFVIVSAHTIAHAVPALATSQVSFVDLAIISAVLSVPMTFGLGIWLGLAGIGLGGVFATLLPSYVHAIRARQIFRNQTHFLSP